MSDVHKTLDERGKNYGEFKDGSNIMQMLKNTMRSTKGWQRLSPSQREALEMIQHKIGRILNGDPNHVDSWHDIAGYAQLIEKELNGEKI
jgi:nucleoid-associated protein YejK